MRRTCAWRGSGRTGPEMLAAAVMSCRLGRMAFHADGEGSECGEQTDFAKLVTAGMRSSCRRLRACRDCDSALPNLNPKFFPPASRPRCFSLSTGVGGGWWRPRHDHRGDRRGEVAQGVADASLNDTLSESLSESLSDTKNGWNPRLSNKVPEKRAAISLHVW